MSDFDDEPTEGVEANEPKGSAVDAATPEEPVRKARSQPVPDDDWDDDWDDEDSDRGGKRDLTLVYAIVAAAIVIVLAVVLTRPSDDDSTGDAGPSGGTAAATTAPAAPVKNWQGPVGDAVGQNGKEAQARAETAEGIYIWTDFGGWHLRNNGAEEATVTIAADQVKEGGGDGSFATEATVTLPAGDGKEGKDIDLGNSESATFTITIGGTNVPAEKIFLGGAEGVADANPVTFTKG